MCSELLADLMAFALPRTLYPGAYLVSAGFGEVTPTWRATTGGNAGARARGAGGISGGDSFRGCGSYDSTSGSQSLRGQGIEVGGELYTA